MIGGQLFYDFARVGATPAPFQSFVLSAGFVTDYVYGAGMHWQGGCGGFPCDGSGSLNERKVIGELKAATPLGGDISRDGPPRLLLSAILSWSRPTASPDDWWTPCLKLARTAIVAFRPRRGRKRGWCRQGFEIAETVRG